MSERIHHERGMSRWPAKIACPFHEPEDMASGAAERGTSLHDDLAAVINGTKSADDVDLSVSWAASVIIDMAKGAEIHVEEKVEIVDPMSDMDGVTGYVDAWFVLDGKLHVVDFKSGGMTDLQYEPQLMGYALGIYSSLRPGTVSERDVYMHVVYGGDFKVKSSVTSIFDCNDMSAEVERRFDNPAAYARNINHACMWCRHRKDCKAVNDAIENFEKDITNMNDVQKLEHFGKINGIIKAESDRIKESIAQGDTISDGDITYRKSHRDGKAVKTDIPALLAKCRDDGVDISESDIIGACSIGKKAFTDMAKAKAKAAGVKVSVLGDIYSQCCEYGTGFDVLERVK